MKFKETLKYFKLRSKAFAKVCEMRTVGISKENNTLTSV